MIKGHPYMILFAIGAVTASCFHCYGQKKNYHPNGWFTGDIHVHRSCNGSRPVPTDSMQRLMEKNNLDILSILADMGNSDAPDRIEDLKKVNGKDAMNSSSDRIIHYSAEWHWDANEWERPHQAMGGHLILLGLNEAHKIWEETTFKILESAKKQNAVSGFAHMQYLNDDFPEKLNCCIPMDYPVEAVMGTIDFISEDCNGGDSALEAWYKLLNCGIRIGLAAGTDYPCNGGAAPGSLLTYVKIKDGKLSYRKWIEGIKSGHTVISRNGNKEFLDFKVNRTSGPGDEIRLISPGNVEVEVIWTSSADFTGRIELVYNGRIVSTHIGSVSCDHSVVFNCTQYFKNSGWICARRMDEKGHQIHTSPVYVIVENRQIRSSAEDAEYFINWIDNILKNISSGEKWNHYFSKDLNIVQERYIQAREIYSRISDEAKQIEKL